MKFSKKKIRIYTKKKKLFDHDSIKLTKKLIKENNIPLINATIYHIYDFFGIKKELLLKYIKKVFIDPITDIVIYNKNHKNPYFNFFLENDNDRSNASTQCIKILYPELDVFIRYGILVEFKFIKKLENKKYKKYIQESKDYIINNYSNFFNFPIKNKKNYSFDKNKIDVKKFSNCSFKKEEIKKITKNWGFSIDLEDLLSIKKFFKQKKRIPTEEELRIIDTYWSDHCRHTTFFTILENISFKGSLKDTYQKIFDEYIKNKKFLGKSKQPLTLMEISKLPYEIFKKNGKKNNIVPFFPKNKENNSCLILSDIIYCNGKKEKWFFSFKNESHNFPTEIDPFSGANTCIGGVIRDSLSSRSFVYQSIRLSGSSDPTNYNNYFFQKKLKSQKKLCIESAKGYSSYGNQIGLATTHVNEIYHKNYIAKRMEVGMVVGGVPKNFVKWKIPKKNDIVLLIGGLTKKEGIGDAKNSSKNFNFEIDKIEHKKQKGNPLLERNIQRFFRKKEVISLIKKCNDIGAGGISIAFGELHESIELYLEKVPIKKDDNLKPIEIALSESQERIAVVLAPSDVEKFVKLAYNDNLIATPVAKITDNKKIVFFYKKRKIFDIENKFLNLKKREKKNSVIVNSPQSISPFKKSKKLVFNKKTFFNTLSKLNISSQLSLSEMFDSTVGGTTVLMPFGGKYQMTPCEGSVQKIPVYKGTTNTVSIVSWGFHPEISKWSPFHGGAYSILECIAKIVSMGGNYKNSYLSFQEYYQKLGNNPKNWGIPFSALLGAYHAQMSLGIICLGGKDSMSGTYKSFNVPPTLISFGVSIGLSSNIISPEFKKPGNKIYLYHHKPLKKNEMPDFDSVKNAYDQIHEGIKSGKIVSIKTIKDGGISIAIAKMSFGNYLGVDINYNKNLLETHIGSLIIESSSKLSNDFIQIGEIVPFKRFNFNGILINIKDSIKNWIKTLHLVFSEKKIKNNNKKVEILFNINVNRKKNKKKYIKRIASPRVFIPIFPGTNGEIESIRSFEKEGAVVNTLVFKNLCKNGIIDSIKKIKEYIDSVQIVMFCGGFSAGDEPNGSAKLIVSILHNIDIKNSIHNFLKRDGLILGICNGFQGLIKSGLLPYGKISYRDKNSPSLIENKMNKHISKCVRIKIISDNSPWLTGMKNKIYTIPISHGEGRFFIKKNKINILKNQIVSQYVDLHKNPTLNNSYNPNGSLYAIEGITDKFGKIYGRMTHPERCYDNDLLKNIPGKKMHSIFYNAVQYFS